APPAADPDGKPRPAAPSKPYSPVVDLSDPTGKTMLPPTRQVAGGDRRTFRNRIWQLDLQIVTGPNGKKVLVGALANLTNRVQMFGNNGRVSFRVRLAGGNSTVDLVFSDRYLTGKGGFKKRAASDKDKTEETVPGDVAILSAKDGAELTSFGANPAIAEYAP